MKFGLYLDAEDEYPELEVDWVDVRLVDAFAAGAVAGVVKVEVGAVDDFVVAVADEDDVEVVWLKDDLERVSLIVTPLSGT